MNVLGQCRSFGTVPSLRQIVFGISFFAIEIPEQGHSISSSFSDINGPGWAGALLERELLVSLGMNGVR
jgi:hypothetical protein